MNRFCIIAPHDVQPKAGQTKEAARIAECRRIDDLARAALARFERSTDERGRMSTDEARVAAAREGWIAELSFACNRHSSTRRVTSVRVVCQVWTRVRDLSACGFVGRSRSDAVTANSWERALRAAKCKALVREQNLRAERVRREEATR